MNHVAKDHGKTLKPAHLSYKCTVCTATFGQYKLFENHVYTTRRRKEEAMAARVKQRKPAGLLENENHFKPPSRMVSLSD